MNPSDTPKPAPILLVTGGSRGIGAATARLAAALHAELEGAERRSTGASHAGGLDNGTRAALRALVEHETTVTLAPSTPIDPTEAP